MTPRPYFARLAEAQQRNNSLLCIGLDPDPARFPEPFGPSTNDIVAFNRAIIEATSDLVCAYKPNWAFYEALGLEGLCALEQTIHCIPNDIPIIADAKRGDIGNTAKCYARSIFDRFGADAVTVSPYMGYDTLEPFLEYADRGIYVLCLTSNAGANDFQRHHDLYLHVARTLSEKDMNGSIGLVVGATQADSIAKVREAAPHLPFLLPGVGTQGGAADEAVQGAWCDRPGAVTVNISRGILYASRKRDFAQAARTAAESYRDLLNAAKPTV
jgi:orotidine-5'-phosphate decarboxylase